jgi:DNA ligase (NAD+)
LTIPISAYYHRRMDSMPDRGQRIAELEKQISAFSSLYYKHEAVITDEEFDALWDELESLDPDNPLLAGIGSDLVDGWPKARHLMPMGSQAKATDPDAFEAWAKKRGYAFFLVQYKLDGASIELQYSGGNLVRAVTRGDGLVGDEITQNVARMSGVVAKLPQNFDGAVRGEVLMSRETHRIKHSDKANCRNAANGIMKRKDGSGCEDLEVVCYDALGTVGLLSPFDSETGKIAWLASMGFQPVTTRECSSVGEIVEYRARIMALRPDLRFDIDGLVVKGDSIDEEDLAKPRPESQIAFKFSPEEGVTVLKAVEWSESGSLYTPIGVMEPVRLAGTTVQRANLCNPDMIRNLKLKIGSKVVITKRGEIIPKIEAVAETPADATDIEFPTACGACGASLADEGTSLRCPNPGCPKKDLHRLAKWIAVLDIREFGEALLKRLHASGRVSKIAQLYALSEGELAAVERMGNLSAAKVLANLRARKDLSLPEFVAGFDIDGVGLLVAQKLVQGGFASLEALRKASVEELVKVDGIAETMAAAIREGFSVLGPEMDAVLETGAVRILESDQATLAKGRLAGKTFCFTGELISMKRAEAEKAIRALGGTAKTSITKDLDYLVTNDPGSGSSKNRKAAELGVAILDEAAFLSLVEGKTNE